MCKKNPKENIDVSKIFDTMLNLYIKINQHDYWK